MLPSHDIVQKKGGVNSTKLVQILQPIMKNDVND